MKRYKFYIYRNKKTEKFCRLIFTVDDSEQEQFVRAETSRYEFPDLSAQVSMGHAEASTFIKNNNLKLIDEFKTRI